MGALLYCVPQPVFHFGLRFRLPDKGCPSIRTKGTRLLTSSKRKQERPSLGHPPLIVKFTTMLIYSRIGSFAARRGLARSAFNTRQRAQVFINGLELMVAHVVEHWPRHYL